MKTPGQIAYEAELQARPNYHDGGPRPAWPQLRPIAKASWEKNPSPRWTAPLADNGHDFSNHQTREGIQP